MPKKIDISQCLPAPDIEALRQGKSILIIPRRFLNSGESFALYPTDDTINSLPTDKYYQPNYLTTAQRSLDFLNSETVPITLWGTCIECQMINEPGDLEKLSPLTIWTEAGLRKQIEKNSCLFLAYVRVYRLDQTLEMPVDFQAKFIPLLNPISVDDKNSILSDENFAKRRQQIDHRQPSLHPELENLQLSLANLSQNNCASLELEEDIKTFLGWSNGESTSKVDPELEWIQNIANVGNSSDGNEFEKLVRKAFIKLGFDNSNQNSKISLDPEGTGGAGGLDFYCETPYPVVGECKATKTEKVPDGTPAQLIKLGQKFLNTGNYPPKQYERCIKIIMAAGELTQAANQVAIGNTMNVLRPETLQRLTEIKAKYPGSIDLLDLKKCLEAQPFGEAADGKVNEYIEGILQKIQVRSHLIEVVKGTLEHQNVESVTLGYLQGAYDHSDPPQPLKSQEMQEILIELSSPLTGYLGRKPGNNGGGDRFYFLRELNFSEKLD